MQIVEFVQCWRLVHTYGHRNSARHHAGFPHLLENLKKWEYTWNTWKNHGILQKIIKIMEKLHGTWKNIWVDYKSLHARGRPQVLCVCLLSGGWNKCSILCMHWNGPRGEGVSFSHLVCLHSSREATPWWLKETDRYPGPLKGKEPKVSLFIFFFFHFWCVSLKTSFEISCYHCSKSLCLRLWQLNTIF